MTGGGDMGGGGAPACTPGTKGTPPVTPRLPRLTFSQYDNTASALVGARVSPSLALGPAVNGMTNVMWTGFRTQAATIAQDAAALMRILPCQPSGDGSACAQQFVTTIGRQAFRRALTSAESARYMDLYNSRQELTPNGTFEEGIQLILEALLQSPNFLVRVERSATTQGNVIPLSGVERASRLSFALWNGPPDEALLSAGESGKLDTADGVRQQAERMLTSTDGGPKARSLLRTASQDYLGMVGSYSQFWVNTERDPNLFPDFYQGIDADFREEVLRFVDHVVFDKGGGYRDLLTSPEAVVNGKLAKIYGLTQAAADWTTVSLDPNQRPGLLTRVGFVGTHGRFSRGSLIYRGAFVLKRLLCLELGSPPAGAANTPLPDASAMLKTDRQRIDAMTANEPCASCHHARINPAGYAMEEFDGIGKFRSMDNGAAVDTTGVIRLDGMMQSYTGAADYAQLLAGANQSHVCYADRFAQFTFSDPSIDISCTAPDLVDGLGQSNSTITGFLADFVANDIFLNRSTMEAP
jgi:hypothetical protein